MDALTTPETPFDAGALARRVGGQFKVWVRHAATFGSAGSMVLAALMGMAAFALALASTPLSAPEAPPVAPAVSQPPLTSISVPRAPPAGEPELAPIGTAPGPAVETVLDYDVTFYWPATPQTVAEPVAIRDGPAPYARVIRSARPGERLRINGRAEDAPRGPWLRVRLEDGRDGYFAAHTVDVGAFRRKRAAEIATPDPAAEAAVADGAPLTLNVPPPPDADFGPPTF